MKKVLVIAGLALLIGMLFSGEALAHGGKRSFGHRKFIQPRSSFFLSFNFAVPFQHYYRPYYRPYYYDRLGPSRHWVPGYWELRTQSPGIYERTWIPGYWIYR